MKKLNILQGIITFLLILFIPVIVFASIPHSKDVTGLLTDFKAEAKPNEVHLWADTSRKANSIVVRFSFTIPANEDLSQQTEDRMIKTGDFAEFEIGKNFKLNPQYPKLILKHQAAPIADVTFRYEPDKRVIAVICFSDEVLSLDNSRDANCFFDAELVFAGVERSALLRQEMIVLDKVYALTFPQFFVFSQDVLDNYIGSKEQLLLLNASIALLKGDLSTVITVIQTLDSIGIHRNAVTSLQSSVSDIVSSWQEHNITPQDLLLLLDRRSAFDPEGSIDEQALRHKAHLHIAGDIDILEYMFLDLNQDGNQELLILSQDMSLHAYALEKYANQEIVITRSSLPELLVFFGDHLLEKSIDTAISCYLAALKIQTTQTARQKAAEAYHLRAEGYLQENDLDAALSDALSSMDIYRSAITFGFYEQLTQQKTEAVVSGAAISLWDTFIKEQSINLVEYDTLEKAQMYGANLRLKYAQDLASNQDPDCVLWFKEAELQGLDISDGLMTAADQFGLGLPRTILYDMAYQRLIKKDEQTKVISVADSLRTDLPKLLESRKIMGIKAQEIFTVISMARDYQSNLQNINLQEIYREACLDVAGGQNDLTSFVFVDWDLDGTEELLALSYDKKMRYYQLDGLFKIVQTIDLSDFTAPSIKVVDECPLPHFLAEDGKDPITGFSLFVQSEGQLKPVLTKQGIYTYKLDDGLIEYQVLLPGSIARFERMSYDMKNPDNPPIFTGYEWQENSYPMPTAPGAAVLRYLEAQCLGIIDEVSRLTGGMIPSDLKNLYSLEELLTTSFPKELETINFEAFLKVDENTFLFEVSNDASSGTQTVYLCVTYNGGGWTIAGAAAVFTDVPVMANSYRRNQSRLICLNDETNDRAEDKTEIKWYKILLPHPVQLNLTWKTGKNPCTSIDFEMNIYDQTSASECYLSYLFNSGKAQQQTLPVFLKAGVYYVSVRVLNWSVSIPYSFTFKETMMQNIELERNNTFTAATKVALNHPYYGSLQTKSDIDMYSFTVSQPIALAVKLMTEHPKTSESSFSLGLFEQEHLSELWRADILGNNSVSITPDVYLAPGEYYMTISKGKEWYGNPYSFVLQSQPEQAIELELNNTALTATPIQINQLFKGASGYPGDVDYYVINLDQTSLVQISFKSAPVSKNKGYQLSLLRDSDTVWEGAIKGSAANSASPLLCLSKGVYYIRVENQFSTANTYQIAMTRSDTPHLMEEEPNDRIESATSLPLETEMYGSLISIDGPVQKDIDNYRFSLSKPGSVNIHFSCNNQSDKDAYYTLTVADARRVKSIYSASIAGDLDGLTTPPLFLGAGEYIVQVTGGNQVSPGAYSIRITSDETEYAEQEWNDELSAATPWLLNKKMRGSSAKLHDADYYTIVLDESGVLQLSFSFIPASSTADVYAVSLAREDKQDDIIWRQTASGSSDSFISPPYCLTPGKYSILVKNLSENKQSYDLSNTFVPVADIEHEPNNAAGQATPIYIGTAITGSLTDKEDMDCYLLSLEDNKKFTLKLEFDATKENQFPFIIEIERNGEIIWTKSIQGSNGGMTAPAELPKGDYVIKIKPFWWTTRLYKISLD